MKSPASISSYHKVRKKDSPGVSGAFSMSFPKNTLKTQEKMLEHQRAESITVEISLTSVSDCGAQELMPVLAFTSALLCSPFLEFHSFTHSQFPRLWPNSQSGPYFWVTHCGGWVTCRSLTSLSRSLWGLCWNLCHLFRSLRQSLNLLEVQLLL